MNTNILGGVGSILNEGANAVIGGVSQGVNVVSQGITDVWESVSDFGESLFGGGSQPKPTVPSAGGSSGFPLPALQSVATMKVAGIPFYVLALGAVAVVLYMRS